MKKLLFISLIGLFLIPLACQQKTISQPETEYRLVARVIDGDTIELSDGISVRYIGINTPEIGEYFSNEAKEANRKLVAGKQVRLEYDKEKIQTKGKGRGRTLAYVYAQGIEAEIFVNAWLVENGYARVSTYPPNVKYQDKFLELEKKARDGKKGLWGNGRQHL